MSARPCPARPYLPGDDRYRPYGRPTIFAVTTELALVVGSSTARAIAARERATLLKHLRERAEERWDEARLAEVDKAVPAAVAERDEATTAEVAEDVPALRPCAAGAGVGLAVAYPPLGLPSRTAVHQRSERGSAVPSEVVSALV